MPNFGTRFELVAPAPGAMMFLVIALMRQPRLLRQFNRLPTCSRPHHTRSECRIRNCIHRVMLRPLAYDASTMVPTITHRSASHLDELAPYGHLWPRQLRFAPSLDKGGTKRRHLAQTEDWETGMTCVRWHPLVRSHSGRAECAAF